MKENQYRRYQTITKVKWTRYNSGHCGLIYKDDLTQDNNNKYIIRRDYKDLLRQNMEITWNSKSYSQ